MEAVAFSESPTRARLVTQERLLKVKRGKEGGKEEEKEGRKEERKEGRKEERKKGIMGG